jgi:hypothetical protein
MTYLQTEVVKTDEEWEFDYLYRAGKPVGAIFGLQANGLFNSTAEINGHPTQSFGQVKPGDIRYVDQNGDGIIDQNDETMLGSSIPKVTGGLNISFNYKNFTLFGLATGSGGHDRHYANSYYWVYGARKYSEAILNRWTSENASTATYPRLSSQASSNNFRPSSYWLYNNSRIAINRVQLNYDFPQAVSSLLKTQSMGMYIRASNLATIARNSERMEMNIGSEPQYRSWSFGIKALF